MRARGQRAREWERGTEKKKPRKEASCDLRQLITSGNFTHQLYADHRMLKKSGTNCIPSGSKSINKEYLAQAIAAIADVKSLCPHYSGTWTLSVCVHLVTAFIQQGPPHADLVNAHAVSDQAGCYPLDPLPPIVSLRLPS